MKPLLGNWTLALACGAAALAGLASALSVARASASDNANAASSTAPPMLRRLTEAQYRRTIADIFGTDIKIVGRFEPDLRSNGLLAVGTTAVSVTAGGFEQYEQMARNIAAQVTDGVHRDKLIGCAPGPSDRKGERCAAQALARIGLRLYRRPVTAPELRWLTTSTLSSAAQLQSFDAGLAATLESMLSSPDFLFRIDERGPGGVVDGYSKATRLSYLLWNTTPDDELLKAAGAGVLDTPQGLAREADRLIASPRFAEGVRAFFTDFLMLDDIDTLSKDVLIFPTFTASVAADAREQTLRTIAYLLVDRNGDYRDLFTSRQIAMNRTLGPLYDIPVEKDGWYIHEFPEGDPRTGLLTQASLLALHAHPGRTSPTLRGKAMREVFLCQQIPTPPANVNFAVVQDVNNPTLRTTRARLQAHLDDEECASCHKLTDPIGLGLEQFDGAGQFRTREHDELIDVSGAFDKKPFANAIQLGQLFHDDPRATDCLVQRALSYATGRELDSADMPEIAQLTRIFGDDGHRFKALMRAIALAPSFYALSAEPRSASRIVMQKGKGKRS